jgi:hypothetical protein
VIVHYVIWVGHIHNGRVLMRENFFVIEEKQGFGFLIPLVDLFHELEEVFFAQSGLFH